MATSFPFQPQYRNRMWLELNWINRSFNRYLGIISFKLKCLSIAIWTFFGNFRISKKNSRMSRKNEFFKIENQIRILQVGSRGPSEEERRSHN